MTKPEPSTTAVLQLLADARQGPASPVARSALHTPAADMVQVPLALSRSSSMGVQSSQLKYQSLPSFQPSSVATSLNSSTW